MRVRKDTFLVEVSDQFVRPNVPGLKFIDTDYNPKILATKTGRIHSLPVAMSSEYRFDVKLEVGDWVVFNHIVCQNNMRFSGNVFICDYFNLFAKVDGDKIIPLEEVIFTEPIMEPDVEIGCFKVAGKVSAKIAKVYEASDYVKTQGVQAGDIMFFTKNADYPIKIGDKDLYKMHLRNVIGLERDGVLTTYRNRLLVKNVTELGSVGGLQKIYADSTLQTGVVINNGNTSIKEGALITYFQGISSAVTWKCQDYSFVNEENIKYVI